MEVITHSVEETNEYAAKFVEKLAQGASNSKEAVVVGLSGELGSGKTTFVKSVAKLFGLEQTVTSPTFVIEKIYKLDNQPFEHLIHIDAYRLESEGELTSLGWNEIVQNAHNIIFIEWPENVKKILPEGMIQIRFEVAGENERSIKITHNA